MQILCIKNSSMPFIVKIKIANLTYCLFVVIILRNTLKVLHNLKKKTFVYTEYAFEKDLQDVLEGNPQSFIKQTVA